LSLTNTLDSSFCVEALEERTRPKCSSMMRTPRHRDHTKRRIVITRFAAS
jgi:hypothetical protein